MRLRCSAACVTRHRYMDRGIAIDPRWDDYAVFLADMGERPVGKTLDREDNDLGYSKENCKWSTPKEQANNRSTTLLTTCFGETLTLSQWADKVNINYKVLWDRINKFGWTPERALTSPPRITS